MGFFIRWDFQLTWFSPRFFPSRYGSAVKLYFSVPVVLYTVFSVQKTLAKHPGQKPGQKSGQKSGHADHVLKTQLCKFLLFSYIFLFFATFLNRFQRLLWNQLKICPRGDLDMLKLNLRSKTFKLFTQTSKFLFLISYYFPINFLLFTISMKSAQNLSPGRFRHAEAESEVKNLQIFQPDLEISISYFLLISFFGFLVITRDHGSFEGRH